MIENKQFVPAKGELLPHVAVAVKREDFERIRRAGFEFGFGPAEGLDGLFRAVTDDPTGNGVEITAS